MWELGVEKWKAANDHATKSHLDILDVIINLWLKRFQCKDSIICDILLKNAYDNNDKRSQTFLNNVLTYN